MLIAHLDIFTLAERLHRKFLDLIQLELDRLEIRDINSVRALIIINLHDNEMTVSELMYRGCYQGSNVSYNLKRLIAEGYISQVQSTNDRRVFIVRNTLKGVELCKTLFDVVNLELSTLMDPATKGNDLMACRNALQTLERSCSRAIDRCVIQNSGRLAA